MKISKTRRRFKQFPSKNSMAESQSQIIVSLSGIDETVYQNVHARHTYGANSIILNHQ